MQSNCGSLRFALVGGIAAVLVLSADPVLALPFLAQTTFGGAGDEVGTGVATNATAVYFSGHSGSQSEGIVGQFAPSLPAAAAWSRSWPSLADTDWFNGIALTANGAFTAGGSRSRTIDTVGDKESKGITVRFNLDGVAGGGVGGGVWDRQTPAAPGGFPYGGIEWLTGVSTSIQSGQNYIYTAGFGERFGFTDRWGTFVTKLDEAGNVVWSKNDTTPSRYPTEPAVAAGPDAVYLASRNDTAAAVPYLKKFDTIGNLQWSRTSTTGGEYRGLTVTDGGIFGVGQAFLGGGATDFLVEAWSTAGVSLWSRTFDLGSVAEVLDGVVAFDGRLFAVGSTKGGTAGGTDGVLLEIDALTGNLIDSTLWGGAADDMFNDLAIAGSTLYAVGSTRSFGAGGSDIAIASFSLPSSGVPEPATLLLTSLGMAGLALSRRREVHRGVWPR